MTWDASKWNLQSLNSNPKNYSKNREHRGQRKNLINSSDNDTDDEEWIQQLERDYGSRHQKKKTKWTRLEKVLIATLFISLVIVILLITSFLYSRYKHGETLLEFTLGGQKFCNEKSCVKASYRVLSYMDEKLDPCEDFYEFTCGSWLKNTDIPFTHTKWSSFTEVSHRNQKRLKQILDNLSLGAENSQAIQKVQKFYNACQRKGFIEKNGNQSLINLINYVGSWAFVNKSSWNEEHWNFGQALTRIHHLKSMPLFYMYVATDDKDSNKNIIQIEQSGITLKDETIYRREENDKLVIAYKRLLITCAFLLGGDKENAVHQANEIFEFEKQLALIFESKHRIRKTDQLYHKMTVADLQLMAPAIPWLDYMNSMFQEPVKAKEEVVVYTPNYLKNMSILVIKTERRIIANYMVWHLVKPLLILASKPYRTAALEFSSKESGMKSSEESWKNCVTKTDAVLGFVTGHLLVKELERSEYYSTDKVKRMLQRIKDEFISNLQHVKWMDKTTKQSVIEKASSIVNMIGYPKWIMDTSQLDKFYEDFTITDDPLRNIFNAREFYHEKTMRRRGQKVRRDEWHMTPTEVNAYYNAPKNYIALPSGILQPPFYDTGAPMAMNFGALGTIMGHELTHGFDNQGQHFDENGNLGNWWSGHSVASFINKTKCLQNQYASFKKKNVSISQNLAENIADNGGLKIAYRAFKSNEYVDGSDKLLPGLKLTPDQLFFMSFAQTWCSVVTPERKKLSSPLRSHSSEKSRVNVVLSNSKDFSKAFNCPVNSAMNPASKCNVW